MFRFMAHVRCGAAVVWCDRTGLKLLEDHQNGLQRVNGLTEVEVLGPHDIFHILERSFYSRRTAETMMNRQSSRSHAIFTISVDMRCHGPHENKGTNALCEQT